MTRICGKCVTLHHDRANNDYQIHGVAAVAIPPRYA
jgi:hypothetical protein